MAYIANKLNILATIFLLFFLYNKNLYSNLFTENFSIYSYVKGIPLADGNILMKFKEKKYSLKISAKSIGVFSLILNWEQTIKSFGVIEESKFKSFRYHSADVRGKKNGYIEINFQNSPPEIISAQPDPSTDKRRNINNSLLVDVNDPAASIFNLALDECKNTVKVFDGKRIYNIKILKKERSVLNDPLLSKRKINTYNCSYEIERLAGYTKKELKKFPRKGNIWIKKHEILNFYYPIKIQIKTKWGHFLCYFERKENIN